MKTLTIRLFLPFIVLFSSLLFALWLLTPLFQAGPVIRSPISSRPLISTGQGQGNAVTSTDFAQSNITTYPANCKGTVTTAKDATKYLLGLDATDIAKKYLNNQDKILCYDDWKWDTDSTQQISTSYFLDFVKWPSDFFTRGVMYVVPLKGPNTTVQDSSDYCNNQGLEFIKIPACGIMIGVYKSTIVQSIRDATYNVTNQANGILWETKPEYTYNNKLFNHFYDLSIWLVNAFLVVAIAWAALRSMTSKLFSDWLTYASSKELLARIVLALLCAYLSMHIVQITIDLSNALCGVFGHDLFNKLGSKDSNDFMTLTLQVIYFLLSILLILEETMRYAILFVCIAFMPLLLFTASLKETQFIAGGAVRGFIFFTLLQPVQMAILSVGESLYESLFKDNSTDILSYLVCIGIMILAIAVFFSFARILLVALCRLVSDSLI
jgi:hypothetical protein